MRAALKSAAKNLLKYFNAISSSLKGIVILL